MINLLALGTSTVRISMPYAAGALGGTLSERGGVVNIALEGLMLSGAFTFATTSWWIQKHWGADWVAYAPTLGLLAAVSVGVLLSLLHALATVTFKADNIISGLAINIFSLGATNFLLKWFFNSSSNSERCPSFSNWTVFSSPDPKSPWLALNQICHPLILLTLVMFVASNILLFRTRFGLRLRSVGENPQAADSLGVNVSFYRYMGVLLGGACASVGGVWLASDQGLFSSNMTNGRGYIALAAMIIGKWKPWGAAVACLIFGFADAVQNRMQIFRQTLSGGDLANLPWLDRIAAETPTQLIQAFPYIVTIIVIAGLIGRSTPPAADGIPYEKERG
ncbi:MAG: ABC transporter permease [Candidatus Sumerlaeaceae bacterium]|nr:ABC transporter permease [Candidatus Sumerlaeaceae bacterium]